MSLWRLAWRFLWSRPLVTALTLAGTNLYTGNTTLATNQSLRVFRPRSNFSCC